MDELEDMNSGDLCSSELGGKWEVSILVVDSAELFDENPRHLSILSGISSTRLLARQPLSKLPSKTNAFTAQSSASFGEKHIPNVLRSSVLDACFFNVGAMQTGGALIRPCPVGVNLSGAGMSLPHTVLCVGTGETMVWGTPEPYTDTISFTGTDFLDSLMVGSNDLIFPLFILFGLSER